MSTTSPASLPAPVAEAEAVDVTGLRKSFGPAEVLRDVALHVPAGTTLALLGPSGCGKTTLLRTIAGLERPDEGAVLLGERTVSAAGVHVPPERRHVGMVFQDWALFPHLSVGRNVGFGLSRVERRSGRVEEALELVDLAGYGTRMPSTLSGGQQQRVALARALATRPGVILLDEPFSNLDSALRVQIRVEVQRLLRQLEVTALFVTHDQEEAFVVGDQIAVMLNGGIVQQATPSELYDAPASRAIAEFIGDANLVRGRARGGHAETTLGQVPLRRPIHGPVDVLLRPEQLAMSSGDGGIVEDIEYYGHDAVYFVRAPDGSTLRTRVLDAPVFDRGEHVVVRFVGGPVVGYVHDGA